MMKLSKSKYDALSKTGRRNLKRTKHSFYLMNV